MERTNLLFKFAATFTLAFAISSAQALVFVSQPTDITSSLDSTIQFEDVEDGDPGTISVFKEFGLLDEIVWGGTLGGAGMVNVTETIANLTVEDWLDYHIGFEFVGSDRGSITFGNLVETSNYFSSLIGGDFTDGTVPSGAEEGNALKITFQLEATECESCVYRISQHPTTVGGTPPIPEPTTLALLGLGLASMGMSRRRGKKA